ncbi:MAG: hypothetical protein JWO65_2298 [Sphingomonas bacterium]|nr:hypothetical protein [Sphingomonas bacterium]
MKRMRGLASVVGLLIGTSALAAGPATYDPHATFAPLALPGPIDTVRSGSGLPGPGYWQNRADYAIHASIDTKAHSLTGEEAISYTNNSPDTLDCLWVQLDQNMYRPRSRSHAADGASSRRGLGSTTGYTIASVEVEQGGKRIAAQAVESDTRLKIVLPTPLAGHGGKAIVHIRYRFDIPTAFGGRMAWGPVKDGEIYDMAQWYPRMAVYDDVRGWDPLPYLAQEFYLEYGDFEYWVTVPASMIVAGSGALQNAPEVLTATERARLAAAARSDKTVAIIAPSEIGQAKTATGVRTWHYRMESTRDVAFSASDAFAWDAARINLPGGKSSIAMSYYPIESAGDAAWGRSTEYLKDSVEHYSRRWFAYPWPAAINIAGPASGMEYPGILFDGIKDKGKELFWITAHEIGHGWFPMIVGFDERRDAWMDEGFNTFIDTFESDDFNHGEYGPKRDSEFAPGGGNPVDEILPVLADPAAPPIVSRADTVIEAYRHPVTYFKSALGLRLLRDQIVGPERFDPAFRRFIATWAYKHPKPSDFFRFMESETGEDLSWWWRGWYLTNSTYDVAATKIAIAPDGRTLVTVENRDPLVMPVTLRVDYADGGHEDVKLPAETWIRQSVSDVPFAAGRRVVAATLDPDHVLPDRDRSNNRVEAGR